MHASIAGDARPATVPGRSVGRCILIAVVVGTMFGPLDLAGQVHAPYPLANLFNSPAVWAAAAFVFGMWARRRSRAVPGAIVLEVVAVVAYYAADVLVRGSSASILVSTTALAWVVLGVLSGTIFGAAGAAVHDSSSAMRTVGIALLPGMFLAEASHQTIRYATTDADGRPDDLVGFSILLVTLAAAALVWLLRGRSTDERFRVLGVTIALAAVGAAGYAVLTG